MLKLLTVIFIAFATACPEPGDARKVVDHCTKSGIQCRMGGGQLGVCMMKTDGTYHCATQH